MENRRRQFFVRDGDHWGLLPGALILILALIIIASGLFYLLADRNLEGATYRAHIEALHSTMQLLLPWLVLANLVGVAMVLIISLTMILGMSLM